MAHKLSGPMTFSPEEPVKVLVTGAAGQIAYSLVFLIARVRAECVRPRR